MTDHPDPVLSVQSGFYEFVSCTGQIVTAIDLQPSETYGVVITNSNGLYRYRLGDQVSVQGRAGQAPLLRFVGRSAGTTDLVGEKLTEAFVCQCLSSACSAQPQGGHGLPDQVMLVACPSDGRKPARYRLAFDAAVVTRLSMQSFSEQFESALNRNPQYAYARQLTQLGPLTLWPVDRLNERWMQYRSEQGQRIGDIKPPVLCDAASFEQMLSDVSWGSRAGKLG